MLTDGSHALGRLVLAQEVLLATLEEPKVRLVDFLKKKQSELEMPLFNQLNYPHLSITWSTLNGSLRPSSVTAATL